MKPLNESLDELQALKQKLIIYLEKLVDEKISSAEADVQSVQTSRDSATKSSAGDKHETGRAMMQIEMENHMSQLAKARNLKGELKQMTFSKPYDSVEAGSMVHSDQGIFLLAIGLGRVKVGNSEVFVISMASPLGSALRGKKVGEMVAFQDKKFTIEQIV